MPQQKSYNTEAGNVFLIILIGIVLFAALSFTVARGFRSETTSNLSDRQATLHAQEVIDYAQKITRATDRLRRKGCSEKEISFFHPDISIPNTAKNRYMNNSSPTDFTCHIFYPQGGNVNFLERIPFYDKITSNPTTTTNYMYHFVTRGQPIGVGTAQNDPSMRIFDVNETFCQAFNKFVVKDSEIYFGRMGAINNAYSDGAWAGDTVWDSYAKPGRGDADNEAELAGRHAACIESPDNPGNYSIYVIFFIR